MKSNQGRKKFRPFLMEKNKGEFCAKCILFVHSKKLRKQLYAKKRVICFYSTGDLLWLLRQKNLERPETAKRLGKSKTKGKFELLWILVKNANVNSFLAFGHLK
jgi:hypothetical protein